LKLWAATHFPSRYHRLLITPTTQYGHPYSGIEDYELKERITK